MNVAILGGGNLGHAMAIMMSHHFDRVAIVARECSTWTQNLKASLPSGEIISARNIVVSDKPEEIVPDVDVIISTYPSHVIPSKLREIASYVKSSQFVGSVVASGGFFWMAKSILGADAKIFSFHRVPFVCRVVERGAMVAILGYKPELSLAISGVDRNDANLSELCNSFAHSFSAPIKKLDSYLEVTISNSNPILHTCRLHSLLNQDRLAAPLYFYRDWTIDASTMLLECDDEIACVARKLPVSFPLFTTLRQHYGVRDAKEMTEKIASIEAFKTITFPLVGDPKSGFRLDPSNRYFVEDLPFGLVVQRAIAKMVGIVTPNMDKVITRLQKYIGREYLASSGELTGSDIGTCGIPENYGIRGVEELTNL